MCFVVFPVPVCAGLEIPDYIVSRPELHDEGPVIFGDTVNFTCSVGRAEPITREQICLYDKETDSFRLMGDSLECAVTNCSLLPRLPGAVYMGLEDTIYDSTFRVQCGRGDVLTGQGPLGDTTVVCDQYGLWDFGTLACISKSNLKLRLQAS